MCLASGVKWRLSQEDYTSLQSDLVGEGVEEPQGSTFMTLALLLDLLNIQTISIKNASAQWQCKMPVPDFPGGTVDKNPPANAGDLGLIPGARRFYVLRSNYAHAPQLLRPPLSSPWTVTTEPVCHSYWSPSTWSLHCAQEKPRRPEAHALQWWVAPTLRNWRKPVQSNDSQRSWKTSGFWRGTPLPSYPWQDSWDSEVYM